MLWAILVQGLLLGLAIAAPVGPIGVLCIRRTLDRGRLVGFFSGCGAATADGFYGLVAAFGLSAVSSALTAHADGLKIVGGLCLCWLGLKTMLSRDAVTLDADVETVSVANQPREKTPSARFSFRRYELLSAYGSTLFLTLTNPATILSFMAIFARLGITRSAHLQSVTLVIGVFTGSLLWWLVLVSGVAWFRNRLTSERLTRFNRVVSKFFGAVIFGFGVLALLL